MALRIGETLIDVIDEELDFPECPRCDSELSVKTPKMQQLEDDEYYCQECEQIIELEEEVQE